MELFCRLETSELSQAICCLFPNNPISESFCMTQKLNCRIQSWSIEILIMISRDLKACNVLISNKTLTCFPFRGRKHFIIFHLFIYLSILLYSMGTKLHMHVYIFFPPIVVLWCKYLNIRSLPNAIQQDLIVNPFQEQYFASVNHMFLIPPSPPGQPQVCSPNPGFSFLWKGSFVVYIRFQI